VLYVSETDVEGMQNALSEVQKSEARQRFVQLGYERKQIFSWRKMADITRQVLTALTIAHLREHAKKIGLVTVISNLETEVAFEEFCAVLQEHADDPNTLLLIEGNDDYAVETLLASAVASVYLCTGLEVNNAISCSGLRPVQVQLLKENAEFHVCLPLSGASFHTPVSHQVSQYEYRPV
jgi:hypothetical protein